MKKLLLIAAVVLTVVLALCVTSFAGLDSMYINASTLDGSNIPGVVGQDQIKIDKGDKLYILGWAAKAGTNLEKVVWTLDGVEKECTDHYIERTDLINHLGIDAAYVGHAGIGDNNNYLELLGVDALDDGTYWCSIVAKYQDGTTQTLKSAFQLVVGNAEGGVFGTLIPRGNNPISVRTHKFGVKVTVPAGYRLTAVTGIQSPTWGNSGPGSSCAATVYTWEGDYATSVSGEVYAYAEEIDHSDNVNMPFIFDNALEPGEYLIVLGGIGEKSIGFYCGSDLGEADAVFYDGEPAPADSYPGLNYTLEKIPLSHINLDFVILWNENVKWIQNCSTLNGADLGEIKGCVDQGANGIELIGWFYPEKASIEAFGYQYEGEEPVFGTMPCEEHADVAAVIEGWGGEWVARAYETRWFSGATIPLREGDNTAKFLVKYTDGTTQVLHEIKYTNGTDVAYNKPVYVEVNAGAQTVLLPYWTKDFINDGSNHIHNGDLMDGVALGVYNQATDAGLDIRYYIDLEGVYDLTKLALHSQGFNSQTFPSAYNVYTSLDGENWDLVASVTGRTGAVDTGVPFIYETANRARYIRVDMLGANDGWGSIGEFEAYGTFVEEASGRPPFVSLSPYIMSYKGSNTGDTGGDTVWMGYTSGRLSASLNFTTDVPFWGLGFPDYWSSPNTPVKLELKNQAGEVVWTHEYVKPTDGAEAWPFFADNSELPAGEYTLTITLTDDTKGDDGNYTHWLVIGHGTKPLGDEYVAHQYGRIGFWLFVHEGIDGDGFVVREYRQHVNIDAIYLDGEDKGKTEGLEIETDENSSSIKVHGWLAANYPIEKYGYKVDGGEAVWDASFMGTDPGTPENPNGDYAAIMNVAKDLFSVPGNGYRVDVIVPVEAGSHEVEIVAFVNGEERHIISFSYAGAEAPATDPTVKVIVGDTETAVIPDGTNQCTLSNEDGKLVVTTADGANDPWVSISLDNIDTSVYTSFTVKYSINGTMHANNVYLRDTSVNPGYSGNSGTWAPPGMDGATEKTFVIATDFPAMDGTILTGVRFPAAAAGGTLVIESITFNAAEPDEPDEPNPPTGNALAIFAIIAALSLTAVVIFKKRAF